ncbi:acyltransferase family protein [Mesorhizobium sp. B263B2A]|jgi:peptidoglycan/LPS O-acetylase OafA/YrhL|uniref:acyltransferase family protein n=1 Tax=Mesorhizobium sp. B263B2A TaxID=2876669 RepID=UPI001CD0F644|nr:acyltransferase family protein [Mesorhizobium sp. B263B2A]MCA0030943.1 acyltransferase [Mesorhizobium sp. B263B2A]
MADNFGSTSERSSKDYLAFLDGLRAIAILSVVFYHLYGDRLPNGFLGVDVFFVISGFVVSYTVSRRYRGQSAFHFVLEFYARRFTRIMPALLVCLLFSALATFLFVPDAWLSTSISKTASSAFVGLSNISLAKGTDYFSPVTEFNPFAHTWSLGVEEQFYVVFPLLFFPWVMGPRGKRFSAFVYGALAVVSMATWLHLLAANPLHAFYMPYARFWQLACGILCLQLVSRIGGRTGLERHCNLAATIALIGLVATFALDFGKGSHGLENIAAVACTTILIGCLYHLGSDRAPHFAVLETRPVRFVGWISYSLYLWHWPVFVIARWTIGIESTATKLAALLIAVAFSLGSYFWIETPTRRLRILRIVPDMAVVALFLVVIAAAFFGFKLMRDNRYEIALSTVMRNRGEWYATSPDTSPQSPGCAVVTETVEEAQFFTKRGCPGEGRSETLFVLGDSHAGAYIPMLERFTLETGIRTVVVWTAGCPFISFNLAQDTAPRCAHATSASAAYVAKIAKRRDLLFLPSLRLARLSFQEGSGPEGNAETSEQQREQTVKNAIEQLTHLSKAGLSIVFEGPKPIFRAAAFRCSDWFNSMNPSCANGFDIDRKLIEKLRSPILQGYAEISAALPNIHVWDPLPTLCPQVTCSAFRNGHPLFFDGDHVTAYANSLLVEDFVSEIEAATSDP